MSALADVVGGALIGGAVVLALAFAIAIVLSVATLSFLVVRTVYQELQPGGELRKPWRRTE